LRGARVRVVGVGSPHGDDQVGWAVADRLADRELPSEVGVDRCAAPATEILPLVSGAQRVILVDAVDTGQAAGTVGTWRGREILGVPGAVSSHGLDLGQVLALGTSLGMLPEDVTLYGIAVDPAACRPGTGGMTAAVSQAVCFVADRIAQVLGAPPGASSIPPGASACPLASSGRRNPIGRPS
jgi:hydrogenase maturation protease